MHQTETSLAIDRRSWQTGEITTAIGRIPQIATRLQWIDRLGSWKARWAINRMDYSVPPGLYAVGTPSPESPVFVSANYKMSFDRLRSSLAGSDGWILVLDTKGINVWCAAGKGTFGTDEVVNRLEQVKLNEVVSHRRLIVPQLGAPGVSAHEVKKRSGFQVIFGPIRADEIPSFLEAGNRTTPGMRRVTFTFRDRVVLIPADLTLTLRYALPVAAVMLILSGFGTDVFAPARVAAYGIPSALLLLLAALAGATLPPALLPWLPGRAFSVKGAVIGVLLAVVLVLNLSNAGMFRGSLSAIAWLFIIPALASFIAMNFTGASTYTSLSGVQREMRTAVPLQLFMATLGSGLWIAGLFI